MKKGSLQSLWVRVRERGSQRSEREREREEEFRSEMRRV